MLKKSKFVLIVFAIVMVVSIADLKAESYRFEGAAGFDYSKYGDEKYNLYSLGGAVYFKEISFSNIPYAEDDFYEKAGYAGIVGMMGKAKIKGDYSGNLDIISISPVINYVFPGIPIFVEFGYTYKKMDGDLSGDDYKDTKNIFSGNIGYFIMNGLAIQAEYERENVKVTWGGDTKTNIDTFGAAFKYVTMISSQMAINLEGGYNRVNSKTENQSTENNNIYSFVGDFYFTPAIGIGGSIKINKGDDKYEAGNTYAVRSSIFFTPRIGLSAEYAIFKANDKDVADNGKEFFILLTGRI